MSIIFSLLLLLALLGFSPSACDARALGVAVQTKESDGDFNPGARVSTPLRPNDANMGKDDDPKVGSGSNGDDRDLKVGSAPGSESVGSVRWRVPHRKKGEAEPGFNLDYLPPKTHPPVHN